MMDRKTTKRSGEISRRGLIRAGAGVAGLAALGAPTILRAQEKKLSFAYEGPAGTAQEIAANIFQEALETASNGAMSITQYPGGQLGSEPTLLRKVLSGDIDIVISSTANASQIAPQSGVFSLHYVFPTFGDVQTALKDEELLELYRALTTEAVEGAQPLGMFALPMRHFFAPKKQIHTLDDIKSQKIRVQATATEDTFFAAYGAIPVHMPFPEVYTSLQTGVIDMAENAISYYGSFKLYEVAPVMSLSEHEANFQVLWMSDKAMNALSDDEKGLIQTAAATVSSEEPPKAQEVADAARKKFEAMGVLFNENVDKQGFIDIATPLQDEIASGLGDHAVAILDRVRALSA